MTRRSPPCSRRRAASSSRSSPSTSSTRAGGPTRGRRAALLLAVTAEAEWVRSPRSAAAPLARYRRRPARLDFMAKGRPGSKAGSASASAKDVCIVRLTEDGVRHQSRVGGASRWSVENARVARGPCRRDYSSEAGNRFARSPRRPTLKRVTVAVEAASSWHHRVIGRWRSSRRRRSPHPKRRSSSSLAPACRTSTSSNQGRG